MDIQILRVTGVHKHVLDIVNRLVELAHFEFIDAETEAALKSMIKTLVRLLEKYTDRVIEFAADAAPATRADAE